jgi:hypothetical protein
VKSTAAVLLLALVAAPAAISAQTLGFSSSLIAEEASSDGNGGGVARPIRPYVGGDRPFSHFAFGGGISPLGINVQTATNLNRYMNVRGTGNVFQFNENNLSTNGFNINAKLNLASAGAALDVYPFPAHGFRVSPGLLFYNRNGATGNFSVHGGTSFTLDNTTYYASASSPVQGFGSVGLHARNQAFTATAGWGNMIPRRGGHFSFPVEAGVAFVGAPTLNIVLNSGQVCDSEGQNCVNVATDADVQTNLQAQVAKYTKDLNPLKTYPIVSVGVAYSFRVSNR